MEAPDARHVTPNSKRAPTTLEPTLELHTEMCGRRRSERKQVLDAQRESRKIHETTTHHASQETPSKRSRMQKDNTPNLKHLRDSSHSTFDSSKSQSKPRQSSVSSPKSHSKSSQSIVSPRRQTRQSLKQSSSPTNSQPTISQSQTKKRKGSQLTIKTSPKRQKWNGNESAKREISLTPEREPSLVFSNGQTTPVMKESDYDFPTYEDSSPSHLTKRPPNPPTSTRTTQSPLFLTRSPTTASALKSKAKHAIPEPRSKSVAKSTPTPRRQRVPSPVKPHPSFSMSLTKPKHAGDTQPLPLSPIEQPITEPIVETDQQTFEEPIEQSIEQPASPQDEPTVQKVRLALEVTPQASQKPVLEAMEQEPEVLPRESTPDEPIQERPIFKPSMREYNPRTLFPPRLFIDPSKRMRRLAPNTPPIVCPRTRAYPPRWCDGITRHLDFETPEDLFNLPEGSLVNPRDVGFRLETPDEVEFWNWYDCQRRDVLDIQTFCPVLRKDHVWDSSDSVVDFVHRLTVEEYNVFKIDWFAHMKIPRGYYEDGFRDAFVHKLLVARWSEEDCTPQVLAEHWSGRSVEEGFDLMAFERETASQVAHDHFEQATLVASQPMSSQWLSHPLASQPYASQPIPTSQPIPMSRRESQVDRKGWRPRPVVSAVAQQMGYRYEGSVKKDAHPIIEDDYTETTIFHSASQTWYNLKVLFDGHGGRVAVDFCLNLIMEKLPPTLEALGEEYTSDKVRFSNVVKSFIKWVDEEYVRWFLEEANVRDQGSTLNICMILPDTGTRLPENLRGEEDGIVNDWFFHAHVGDGRVVLLGNPPAKSRQGMEVCFYSEDHDPGHPIKAHAILNESKDTGRAILQLQRAADKEFGKVAPPETYLEKIPEKTNAPRLEWDSVYPLTGTYHPPACTTSPPNLTKIPKGVPLQDVSLTGFPYTSLSQTEENWVDHQMPIHPDGSIYRHYKHFDNMRPARVLRKNPAFTNLYPHWRELRISADLSIGLGDSMGDVLFKLDPPVFKCEPDVVWFKLDPNRLYMILMASDGLWDSLDPGAEHPLRQCDVLRNHFKYYTQELMRSWMDMEKNGWREWEKKHQMDFARVDGFEFTAKETDVYQVYSERWRRQLSGLAMGLCQREKGPFNVPYVNRRSWDDCTVSLSVVLERRGGYCPTANTMGATQSRGPRPSSQFAHLEATQSPPHS